MSAIHAAAQSCRAAQEQAEAKAHAFALIIGGTSAAKWLGLERLLAADMAVVRCPGSPIQLASVCERLTPCVVILDQATLESADPAELGLVLDFGRPVRALIEIERNDLDTVAMLLRKGCMGVLPPAAAPSLVRKAVLAVAAGEFWVSRTVMSNLLQTLLVTERCGLTQRENEILRLVAQGCKNHEIADRLFISQQTVRWHLRSLYGKLGVHDRLGAALFVSGLSQGPALPVSPQPGQDATAAGPAWVPPFDRPAD